MDDDHAPRSIIKGKRTKRPRPPSSSPPINFPSSSGENHFSPVTSDYGTTEADDEEEDMANCLILLARSGTESRNFTAKAAIVDGFYGHGYECKTCNKTFHSFQALGGHRASHKRSKTSEITHPFQFGDDDGREQVKLSMKNMITIRDRLIKKTSSSGSSKVHECAICGSEFSSGQALGGHMRRHRSITTTNSSTAQITNLDNIEKDRNLGESEEGRRFLVLDLNLPAPEEDQVFTTMNQSPMVFATPSLVDCHY